MIEHPRNVGDLFVIHLTRKTGETGFYCDMPDGDAFYEKICMETRLFKTWSSAKMKSNQLNKYGTAVVMKVQQIIDNPKLAEKFGLTGNRKVDMDNLYLIVGYSDESVKHWIHYDAGKGIYYLDKQEAGACLWNKNQVEGKIKMFEAMSSITIKNLTSEKLQSNEKD